MKMRDDEVMALALLFHQTYERLAPSFSYKTQIATRQFDPDSPNGKLMLAVCHDIGREMLRAGMERAADICDGVDCLRGELANYSAQEAYGLGCDQCADTIRAEMDK